MRWNVFFLASSSEIGFRILIYLRNFSLRCFSSYFDRRTRPEFILKIAYLIREEKTEKCYKFAVMARRSEISTSQLAIPDGKSVVPITRFAPAKLKWSFAENSNGSYFLFGFKNIKKSREKGKLKKNKTNLVEFQFQLVRITDELGTNNPESPIKPHLRGALEICEAHLRGFYSG